MRRLKYKFMAVLSAHILCLNFLSTTQLENCCSSYAIVAHSKY